MGFEADFAREEEIYMQGWDACKERFTEQIQSLLDDLNKAGHLDSVSWSMLTEKLKELSGS